LQHETDFKQLPICLPSRSLYFNRTFHIGKQVALDLHLGQIIILATDAVASWILRSGAGEFASPWDAAHKVADQTADSWATFIDRLRVKNAIVDDDSTALVLRLNPNEGVHLSATPALDPTTVAQRTHKLVEAHDTGDLVQMAILYGDGKSVTTSLAQETIAHARDVANALTTVRTALRNALAKGGDIRASVEPIWLTYAPLLAEQRAATTLRESLAKMGVLSMSTTPFPSVGGTLDMQVVQGRGSVLPTSEYAVDESVPPTQANTSALVERNTPVMPNTVSAKTSLRQDATGSDSKVTEPQGGKSVSSELQKATRQRLDAAIASDNDEQIAESYNLCVKQGILNPRETPSDRIVLARQRVAALKKFRNAVAYDPEDKIVAAYDAPLLSYGSSLNDYERGRLKEAQEVVAMFKTIRQSLAAGDNTTTSTVYTTLTQMSFTTRMAFTEEEKQRIWQALALSALENLRSAIQQEDDEAIDESFVKVLRREQQAKITDEDSKILNRSRVRLELFRKLKAAIESRDKDTLAKLVSGYQRTLVEVQDERKQQEANALARFAIAYESQDDERMIAAFDPILRESSQWPPAQRKHYDEAVHRVTALHSLREAINSEDDLRIALAADPVLLPDKRLSHPDRQRIRSALHHMAERWTKRNAGNKPSFITFISTKLRRKED
jgi:hypothetical protein